MANIPKPMNPYAETDFDNAVDNALADACRAEAKKASDAMKKAFKDANTKEWKLTPLIVEEHTNKAVLFYLSQGAWMDFISILIANGYEVTAKVVNEETEIEITWGDK